VVVASVCTWVLSGAVPARAAPPFDAPSLLRAAAFREFESPPDIVWNGRIAALSIHPADGDHVLAASDSGGLFRSADGGLTWTHVDTLRPSRLFDIARDPVRPWIVIAAAAGDGRSVNGGGIWVSYDGGQRWFKPASSNPPASTACSPQASALSISFAPDSEDVFVATECGLAVSHDDGLHWTHMTPSVNQPVVSVLAHAGGIVDVFGGAGFQRSFDGGLSFTGPAPDVRGHSDFLPHALAGDQNDPNFVLLALLTSDGSRVLETDDGGQSWTDVSNGAGFSGRSTRPPFVSTAASTDGQPGHTDLYFGDGVFLWRQTCSNTQQPRCSAGFGFVSIGHLDPSQVGFDPQTGCARYLATDGGFHVSADCGATFPVPSSHPPAGLDALQLYEVASQVHPDHTDLYFGTQDNGFWASPDGGQTWPASTGSEGFLFSLLHATASDQGQELTFSDFANGVQLASAHFASVTGFPHPPVPFTGIPAILAPHVFVEFGRPADGEDRLWITTDSGASWSEVPGSVIPEGRSGRIFVAGPADSPVLYQPLSGGTHLVRITGVLQGVAQVEAADVGLSNVAGHCTEFCAPVFAVDPLDPNHLLVADDVDQVMKVSRDGHTWHSDPQLTELVTGAGEFLFSVLSFGTQASAIGFHPTREGIILVGTDGHGVIATRDGGTRWSRVRGTREIPEITAFAFDEEEETVNVSSFGRGLWKLPDWLLP
jgi:photosystem II stability/assembly factor-like uncharacterized protein